jgi:hypothetical protein
MTAESESTPPDPSAFVLAVGEITERLGWPMRFSDQGDESVCVALTKSDPSFERCIWVYDTGRVTLRCMLVTRERVTPQLEGPILELCARVNESLPFGCLEYGFGERVLVFRDSCDLDYGPLGTLVEGTTSRVLNLAKRYAPAIASVTSGSAPADAVARADEN